MGLALDEPRDTDETAQHDGLTFMMDPELAGWLERMRVAIEVDPWRGGLSAHIVGQEAC